jgi:CRISPR-associated protein Cas2
VARRRYIVAYDIRNDKRLRAVHKAMKQFGYPLQYSVFVCDLSGSEKIGLKEALGNLIRYSEDSIAVVDLGGAEERGVECFEFMGVFHPLPRTEPKVI